MKEFNLQAAKNGAPIQTRDGHNARIVCFDLKDPVRPLLVLIEENVPGETGITKNVTENVVRYATSGKCATDQPEKDLVIVTTPRVGWVNIYKIDDNRVVKGVFPTEEIAMENAFAGRVHAVATVKIEWEE